MTGPVAPEWRRGDGRVLGSGDLGDRDRVTGGMLWGRRRGDRVFGVTSGVGDPLAMGVSGLGRMGVTGMR